MPPPRHYGSGSGSVFGSVIIRIQIRDPDRHQNLIICSLAHCQPSLKISYKSVWKLLRKVVNRQTDRQTYRQTDKQRRLHNLLGGGNNSCVIFLSAKTVAKVGSATSTDSFLVGTAAVGLNIFRHSNVDCINLTLEFLVRPCGRIAAERMTVFRLLRGRLLFHFAPTMSRPTHLLQISTSSVQIWDIGPRKLHISGNLGIQTPHMDVQGPTQATLRDSYTKFSGFVGNSMTVLCL